MIAPDSASVMSPSTMTGDLPSGARREAGRRRASFRVALVALDLVGNLQLFEEPEDAL